MFQYYPKICQFTKYKTRHLTKKIVNSYKILRIHFDIQRALLKTKFCQEVLEPKTYLKYQLKLPSP